MYDRTMRHNYRANIMSELIPEINALPPRLSPCQEYVCMYIHTVRGLYSTLVAGAGGRQPAIEIRCHLCSRYENNSILISLGGI